MKRHLTLTLSLVLGVGVFAATGALADSGAETKIHIHHQAGGFFGDVSSSKANRCANGRKVILYKVTGNEPHPNDDKKIGDDIAQPNNNEYQWAINTDKKGDFYAFARKKDGCQEGLSKTISHG